MKTIKIACHGAGTLELEHIEAFQGNLKDLSKENYSKLRKQILELGFSEPCSVWKAPDGTYKAINCHQRLRVLTELKRSEGYHIPPLPVSFVEAETEHEAKKKILALTSQFGEITKEGLFEFASLNNIDLPTLEDFRFPEIDLEDFRAEFFESTVEGQCDEDEVPEDVEPRTKLGDLYILGEHRLLCGDSTNIQYVERLMNGDRADMVFTDPPYGINESAAKRESRETNSLAKSNKHLKEFKDDSIHYAINAFNICQNLQIPIQIWFGANYYCHSLPQTNNWLVWDKRLEEKQIDNNSDAELAWVQDGRSSVRIFRHLWKGLIKGSEHGQQRVHPTQKPTALAEWCLERYKESKSCLDLFGGSGSTLIACEKTNRKCFMMELDPHYCDVIVARWEKYTGKKAELIESNSKEPESQSQ